LRSYFSFFQDEKTANSELFIPIAIGIQRRKNGKEQVRWWILFCHHSVHLINDTFMKNLSLLVSLLSLVLAASCGLKEQKRIDMNQVAQIEDSILKAQIVPNTTSVHIYQNGQDGDYSKAFIIIVNNRLYKSKDNDKMQQSAIRTGLMLARVLGPDMTVSKATLVISMNDPNEDKVPDDGINVDMKIDSLKKALYPGK